MEHCLSKDHHLTKRLDVSGMARRAWCADDGLVHRTIVHAVLSLTGGQPLKFLARFRTCDMAELARSGPIDESHPNGARAAVKAIDVPDEPAPVNCLGCMGGL